ncbi:hypothetical protein BC833DRAFT_592348 [Globomyces pollinis-pini]|nr:hypothetical protein BC833DRAFT_609118 [Globomyces pollinis-pini]KAI8897758.1 hypothetical protein BC833DRAFT_592348 [Globomyces pollinis-pini]
MVSLTSLITVIVSVQAHLMLKTPAPRTSDEMGQLTGPCGGVDTPGQRTTVEGGKMSFRLGVGDPDAKVAVNVASGENPTVFPNQIFSASYGKAAYQTIDLDFKKVAGIVNGPATIQIIQDGKKYVCVDLTLKGLVDAAPTAPTGSTNTTTSTTGTNAATNSTTSPSATSPTPKSSAENVFGQQSALMALLMLLNVL